MSDQIILDLVAGQAKNTAQLESLKEDVAEIKADIKAIKYTQEKNGTAEGKAWKKIVLTALPIVLGSGAVTALFNALSCAF